MGGAHLGDKCTLTRATTFETEWYRLPGMPVVSWCVKLLPGAGGISEYRSTSYVSASWGLVELLS